MRANCVVRFVSPRGLSIEFLHDFACYHLLQTFLYKRVPELRTRSHVEKYMCIDSHVGVQHKVYNISFVTYRYVQEVNT